MTGLAHTEREGIITTLLAAGPEAPTMCVGWTTRDLAAHLVARERRPDAALAAVVPGLAGWSEQVRHRYAGMRFGALVGLLESPPWWSPFAITAVDTAANGAEFFIHHEDIRRAMTGWVPRDLSRADRESLWAGLRMAGLLLRRTAMAVKLISPGFGQRTVGRGPVQAVVTGDPGEVVLFCSGRQQVARVEVTGSQAKRLARMRLGL